MAVSFLVLDRICEIASTGLSICASRTNGRAQDASAEVFPAGQERVPVSRSEPSWLAAPGEVVRPAIDRLFDLSTENDELVSQQRVFRQQFSLASGQVGKHAEHQGGRRRFDPTQNSFLEHMKVEADSSLDRGKHTEHK